MSAWAVTACSQTIPDRPSTQASDSTEVITTEKKSGADVWKLLPQPKPQTYESGFLPPGTDPENRLGWPFMKHLAADQKQFWTSPTAITHGGAKTFVPFAAFTGLLIGSDSWIARQVPDKPNQLKRSLDISNYSVYSLIGAGGGAFLWGHFTNNDHLRETGLLGGEAAINSTAVDYVFKGITQRPRPLVGDGNGTFFQGGNSFASEHSALAWSIASVVAHEYPGPLSKLAAYGLASAVTLTRVTSKQHFASDAVVGSALGWYLGRQAYRAHHDPELGGTAWGDFLEEKTETARNPANMGSPYVPVDSWVYPAFEKLIALGYIKSAMLGMRPWTRMECARLLDEAQEKLRYEGVEDEGGQKLYGVLAEEFASETERLNGASNLGANVDSIYTRVTGISGPPLRDSYHFNQTIINDFGRPYGEGVNEIAGVSARAVAGPFWISFQGEYQHAPSTPSYPLSTQQAIANVDATAPFANGTNMIDRFQLIDGSVGLTFGNVQFSFGKKSTWFSPSESGSLLFSDNAAPIAELRIASVSPYKIPLLSRVLGPVRTEFFGGQLSGQRFIFDGNNLLGPNNIDPQPYIHADKISFKPTPNLELGIGITAVFSGPGLPFTWRNFIRTYYVHVPSILENPSKRFSAFDFSYRIPGLRKWLTLYNDSLVVDEVSPIASGRPTVNPGVYLPQIPKVPKLDLRFEFLRTARTHEFGPGFVYYDRRYRSGYTSDGNLLGSWIGRQGTGVQAWSSYSFSPRTRIQLQYRHMQVDREFLEGGHLNDFGMHSEVMLGRDLACSASFQYETWAFPVIAAHPKSNISASVQFTFMPHWKIR